MEANEIKTMEIKCRTCLQFQNKCYNVFDYDINGRLISHMLQECTTIKLDRNDGLPGRVCNICLKKLNEAYEFRIMAIKADKNLRITKNINVLQRNVNNQPLLIKEEMPIVDNLASNNAIDGFCEDTVQRKIINTHVLPLSDENHHPVTVSFDEEKRVDIIDQSDKKIATTDNFLKSNDISESSISGKHLHDQQFIEHSNETLMKVNKFDDDSSFAVSDHESFLDSEPVQPDIKDKTPEDHRTGSDSLINSLDISSMYRIAGAGLSKKEKNKKTIYCKICNRSFGFRYYFEIHIRNHTGEVPFKCDMCGKGFAKRFMLKNHKRIHSDNKSYSCDKCGKAFKFLNGLIGHRVIHSDERPQYKCDMCGKSFSQMGALKAHIERHKDERQHTCEICGKGFNCKTGLLHHMACHKSEKDVSCSECGKCFASKGRMQDHVRRSHAQEKPHACNYCNRHFSDKRVLRQHLLIHTGAKPHTCKVCGKCFRHTSTVSNHMRIHTGETPFACELCPLKFKYKHHLSNHMKVHQ